jgi:hypothetical protein
VQRSFAGRATRLAAALAIALPAAVRALDPPLDCPACTDFPPTTSPWQWQLSGRIKLRVPATVYDVDGGDQGADVIASLKARGRRVICYFSAGTWEEFREDAAGFPPEVRGRPLADFPDERWLDVRRIDLLAPVLLARLDRFAAKGCDAVEPDNVAGYTNDSGFPLTPEDQLTFNVWIANQAHARGLAVGLKNDPDQVAVLVPYFDFAVVEQCFEFGECERYVPFIAAGKAVFVAEYRVPPRRFCRRARRLGFSAIHKRLRLDAFRAACR